MCGRYVIARAAGDLMDALGIEAPDVDGAEDSAEQLELRPDYNVAPTKDVPIVLERLVEPAGDLPAGQPPAGYRRELHVARWGLVPIWAKDLSFSSRAFNARSETVTSKPTFRSAVKARRCAIPVDGYYEWLAPEKPGGRKRPFFVHRKDGAPIVFAGLYEWWKDPNAQQDPAGATTGATGENPWVLSCTMLTCASPSPDSAGMAGELGRLHDRLPVPLGDEAALSAWLDPQNEDATTLVAEAVAHAYDSLGEWEMHEVDPAVGNVRNNGPELITPIDDIEPPLF